MEVVGEAGIGWQLARVWAGTRTRERSLKARAARPGAARSASSAASAPAPPARPTCAFEFGARAAARTTAPTVRALAGGAA